MSSQDAIDVSEKPKSNSPERKPRWFFWFRNDGSLHDRVLTAVVVVALAVALSSCAMVVPFGRFLSVIFVAWIAGASTFEVVRLFARHHATTAYRPAWGVMLFVVLLLPSLGAIIGAVDGVLGGSISTTPAYAATVISAVLLMLLLVIEGRNDLKRAEDFCKGLVPSFLLLGCCMPMLVLLAGVPGAVALLWWLVGVVALNDSAAYFVGRAVGKRPLAPALSPKKTVEGSLAGLLVGVVAGVALWDIFLGFNMSVTALVVLSGMVVVMAQCGDLAKSYVKRIRGVKDFGSLLPGHGGVLDRFDALITAAPIVFVVLVVLGFIQCK